jgi:hypothetical protein
MDETGAGKNGSCKRKKNIAALPVALLLCNLSYSEKLNTLTNLEQWSFLVK